MDEDSQDILPWTHRPFGKKQVRLAPKSFNIPLLTFPTRYNSITRFNAEHSRSSRPRRKTPDLLPYLNHRKSESVSSSSSVSPSTPSIPMPDLASFSSPIDSVPESYLFEHLLGWPQASPTSDNGDDITSFYPPNSGYEMKNSNVVPESLLIPSSNITSDHTFELTMNQALSAFPDDSHLLYASALPTPPSEHVFPHGYPAQHRPSSQQNMYSLPTYTSYPGVYSQNDVANHLAMFNHSSSQVDSQTGINWGHNQMFDPSRLQDNHRSKMPVESVSITPVIAVIQSTELYHHLVCILKTEHLPCIQPNAM